MKWNNKGHEFDEVYGKIHEKKSFYLFGAGDYGNLFFKMFHQQLEIIGYIDNDICKQGKSVNGIPCYNLSELKIGDEQGIILTMSQMARGDVITQLIKRGYVEDVDFWVIEEFISVYYVYEHNKVFFSSISFLPSTVCNLKCKHCLNFNPFAKKFYIREWQQLKNDVDLFFEKIDYVMLFHVSGGEPLLYKYTADLIEYIDKNYRPQIGRLRTVTNGTIIPSRETLEKLSKCNVEITVDDYRETVPQYADNFTVLIDLLEEYHISYYINKADYWIDLAPERTDYSSMSETNLMKHRDECNQSWQELREGKLYSCNYAAYATVAGIAGEQDLEEVYDLRKSTEDNKKELIEFRLGYTEKGYTNFCKKCRGFTIYNSEKIQPAVQCSVNNVIGEE